MKIDLRLFTIGVAVLAFAGCTNETTSVPSSPQANVYLQLDREGRPGVKEIFEPFADHGTSDRAIPSNDTVLKNDIMNYPVTATPGTGTPGTEPMALVTMLGTDELKINLAGTGNASYLAIETGNTGAFGGRAISDDVMSSDLNAAYGTLFGGTTAAVPCLISDNVMSKSSPAATSGAGSTAFPYLAVPQ